MKKLTALLLILVMTVSGTLVSVSAKSDRLGNYEHSDSDFSKIKYEPYDFEGLLEKMNNLAELAKDKKNSLEVEQILYSLIDDLKKILDGRTLLNYEYAKDTANADKYQEMLAYTMSCQTYMSMLVENIMALGNSECAEVLVKLSEGEDIFSIIGSSPFFGEQSELSSKRLEILSEWYMMDKETEYKGKKYSRDSIGAAIAEGTITEDEGNEIIAQLFDEQAIKTADVYFRLANIDNEIAKSYGFDNYLDYAYAVLYNRKITPDELVKISRSIIEAFEAATPFLNAYNSPWLSLLEIKGFDGDIAEVFGGFMEKMAPEFKESFDYMKKTNGLIISDNENTSSYTSRLNQYNMPFILLSEGNNKIETFKSLLHEFGNYNSFYWLDGNMSENLDTDFQEIFASGLEMLFSKYYSELMSEGGNSEAKNNFGNVMFSILTSCNGVLTEYEVYKGNYKTSEDLYKALKKISDDFLNSTGYYYTWYFNQNLFTYPGYTSGLLLSDLTAVELFTLSEEDYDDSVDKYIKLLGNAKLSFREALEKAGLTSEWTEEKVKALCEKAAMYFIDNDAPVINGVTDGGSYDGTVDISVFDDSVLKIITKQNDDLFTKKSRSFEIGGMSSSDFGKFNYTIEAVDLFGNTSKVSFEAENKPFIATVTENEEGAHVISWEKVQNSDILTDYYKVYGAPLGKKYKLLGTTGAEETTFVHAGSDDKVWKYYIVAKSSDKQVSSAIDKSFKTYFACSDNAKYTNSKSVEIAEGDNLDMKAGSKIRLTVNGELEDTSKKIFSGKNVKTIRYLSSNKNIATVSKKGTVKAIAEGTCYIYCLTENGLMDSIEINVK